MWWPPRSNTDSKEESTFHEDSLTRPHLYRRNLNHRNPDVNVDKVNEENDQSSAARSLPQRTLREVESVFRLASPTVALSIDRPEIDNKEESVVSYGKSQPNNTTKNVMGRLNLEEQEPKFTLASVAKRISGFENVSNAGACVECPSEMQITNTKQIFEEEEQEKNNYKVSKQEVKDNNNNNNAKITEEMMMALWSSLKESQAKTMQLERQLMQIVDQASTKNEPDTSNNVAICEEEVEVKESTSNCEENNNRNNVSINENATVDKTQEVSRVNDEYFLETKLVENGHNFANAMHTIGMENDLFDFSSLMEQWQTCLQQLQDVKRKMTNASTSITVTNNSNKQNKNEVTSECLIAKANEAEKNFIKHNTSSESKINFDKMLLEVLESEHTAVLELTTAWVNERSALLLQLEEHENNVKLLESRNEMHLREFNEDHSAEMAHLQNHVEHLEKQLYLLLEESSSSKAEAKTETTRTAKVVHKNSAEANQNEARETQSSLIVPRTDVGTSRSEWTSTFARPRSYAPLPMLSSAAPIQQNIIAVNGEAQTTLSLEYIRASLWQIYEAKLPRSIRREREYELLELLLREVERLQHAVTVKNSLILQLQEQRNRFLSSVTAPLSLVEIEDLL